MTESEPRRASRTALTIGLAAVFGGLWLFLDAQGLGVPPFKRLWPILLLLAAGAALVDYTALSRAPRAAGWSMVWFGFSVLGFALALGYTNWRRILDWLPGVPVILALGLIVTWLADRRRRENLVISGGILLVLGVMGFGARHDWLQKLLPSAQVLWAGLLLLAGGFLVWRNLSGARR